MKTSTPILLATGIALMQRLRMPTKLALMALLLLAPLVLLLVAGGIAQWRELQARQVERSAADAAARVLEAARLLQTHRGLTNRLLSGDSGATAPLDQMRTRLDAALESADTAVAALPAPVRPAAWAGWLEIARSLAAGRHAPDRERAFDEHAAAIAAARWLLEDLGDGSGLARADDPAARRAADLVLERLLPWAETLGLLRGQGAGVLARGDASGSERAQLAARVATARLASADATRRVEALAAAGVPLPASWATARQASDDFAAAASARFSAEAIEGDPGAYFDAGTRAIDAIAALESELVSTLRATLHAREAAQRLALAVAGGLVLAGALLLGWLAAAFYASFRGAVVALHGGMDAVARGDLAARTEVSGRDELAGIAALVERMNERLSAMVAEIRSHAARVGLAGRQTADGSRALAERTEEQAASLRQTVATVHALAEAVAASARAAGDADRLTGELRERAEAGGRAMQDGLQAMAQLEGGSRRVGEIVGVIDAIAFQTNILALNAAVEAARAGEAGRGFAVVAAEVRLLARRSADAAGEIRALIDDSTRRVGTTAQSIQAVGTLLGELVGGVRNASDALRSIAAASARQSADLEQLSANVAGLDGITQRNAEMVSESAAAAQELVHRAAGLAEAVASVRLRQGTADEAHALVERALPLLQRQGVAGARTSLQSREQGFVDRDLYVFVIDRAGRYVVHGAKPAMEGRRVHEVPGIDGDRFLRDALAAAAAGSGWIDYDIVDPTSGRVMPKTSYIVRLDDAHFVGCGVYRRTAAAAPAPASTGARANAPSFAPGQPLSMRTA